MHDFVKELPSEISQNGQKRSKNGFLVPFVTYFLTITSLMSNLVNWDVRNSKMTLLLLSDNVKCPKLCPEATMVKHSNSPKWHKYLVLGLLFDVEFIFHNYQRHSLQKLPLPINFGKNGLLAFW